jgi:hypothetical protein
MARNLPADLKEAAAKAAAENEQAKAKEPEAKPGEQSGAPEVAPVPAGPAAELHRFKILNEPAPGRTGFPIVVDGAVVTLAKGKVVDDATYDLDLLRRQGVLLEPLST